MTLTIYGRVLIPGSAQGEAVVSQEPLSFWGGVNPYNGEITDRRHDHFGTNISGKVFLFPKGRGSSTGSAVLLESIRNGMAPAAIINMNEDPILALGAIISDELYGRTIPVLVINGEDFSQISEGDWIKIDPLGMIQVTPSSRKPG